MYAQSDSDHGGDEATMQGVEAPKHTVCITGAGNTAHVLIPYLAKQGLPAGRLPIALNNGAFGGEGGGIGRL